MSYVRVEELSDGWQWSVLDVCAVFAVLCAAALKMKDCRSRRGHVD